MIDKCDLRIPRNAPFRPEFRWIEKEVAYAGSCSPIRRSTHYQGVVSLRAFGLDALLHAYYKRSLSGPHKLELLATGRKSFETLARIITSVFDVDPFLLELMRIDFAADLPATTPEYMRSVMRVKYKRTANEHGELDYELIGGRQLEYFRYGKSPNCVRVYDKIRECLVRYKQIERNTQGSVDAPSFEKLFGYVPDAVVTRIERQAGSGGVPRELSSFGSLRGAADFNPFTKIDILPATSCFPDIDRYGTAKTIKLLGTRAFIEHFGLQRGRALMNRDGNGNRFLKPYAEFLDTWKDAEQITADKILDSYRQSVLRQIDGTITTIDMLGVQAYDSSPDEVAEEHPGILSRTGPDRCGQTPCKHDT